MSRDHIFEALVLRRFPVGDAHRSVTFFTRERGLVSAIAHGAAKSQNRLKLLTTPLRHVTLKAYHDPVADSWKVTDLEPRHLLGGLGESLDRALASSFWTELLLGCWQTGDVFDLFTDALIALDTADGHQVAVLETQLLWRVLAVGGLSPELARCSECNEVLAGRNLWINGESNQALCPECAGTSGLASRSWGISSRAVDWLLATEPLSFEETLAAVVNPEDLASLRTEGRQAWERALGRGFRSVRPTAVAVDRSRG